MARGEANKPSSHSADDDNGTSSTKDPKDTKGGSSKDEKGGQEKTGDPKGPSNAKEASLANSNGVAGQQKKDSKDKEGHAKASAAGRVKEEKESEPKVGDVMSAKRTDGHWHSAEILHVRQRGQAGHVEYFVHYENFNRRLDEWVTRDRIRELSQQDNASQGNGGSGHATSSAGQATDADGREGDGGGERKITRNQKRKHDEINHVQQSFAEMDPTTAALEKEHEALTKVKFIDKVILTLQYRRALWLSMPLRRVH